MNFLIVLGTVQIGMKQVVKALKELRTSKSLRGEEWSEEDGLILYRNKVYIPLDFKL